MQAHALHDLAHGLAGVAVQLGVDLVEGAEQEGQGHHVQALVKVGVDDVGVGGEVDGAVHNALDALGLVAGGQLVGGVDLDGDGAAGGVADHLAEVTAHVGPAGVLGGGAGVLPGHLLELGSVAAAVAGGRGVVVGGGIGGGVVAAAAGSQRQYHGQGHEQCKKLFHLFSSSKIYSCVYLKSHEVTADQTGVFRNTVEKKGM